MHWRNGMKWERHLFTLALAIVAIMSFGQLIYVVFGPGEFTDSETIVIAGMLVLVLVLRYLLHREHQRSQRK